MKREQRSNVVPLAVGAAVVALAAFAVVDCYAKRQVIEAGFWFDGVTFEVPIASTALKPPITDEEQARIRSIAASELGRAYAGLRIAFSENRRAMYRVRVVQDFPARPGPPRAAGESRPLGPLGGEGAVSFRTVAAYAIQFAPPDGNRAVVVDGIAKGIGRIAAHEFAHQLLFGERLGISTTCGATSTSGPIAPSSTTASCTGTPRGSFS